VEDAGNDSGYETTAEKHAPNDSANGICDISPNVKFFDRGQLSAQAAGKSELEKQHEQAGNAAGEKRENGVGRESCVLYPETFADYDVGWISDEKDHARRIRCGELSHEQRQAIKLSKASVESNRDIHKTRTPVASV